MSTELSDTTAASTPIPSTGIAVSATGLRKSYGRGGTSVEALKGVDVSFETGKFTAIMGPSGSGKSTLMHCLAALDGADAGQITLGGTEITGMSEKELTILRRERVGFVFQAFNLVPTLTAEQNILLPLELASKKAEPGWFEEITTALGLKERLSHRPHELSGGQQQRVAVARALLTRPDVIFGDEPTGNLDSVAGAEVLSLLRRASREYGQTVIMVTHDPGAASYADRVVLMNDGELAGVLENPTVDSVLAALGRVTA